ncbi:MAG: LysR family transcriptional regulator [Sphingomonadales bacterium]|nr:LysR family transcriptional regulator [Sphingomonadales bacterium]
MAIELRQLRYAVLTADSQSFARAAARLNMKQSTLSRRVKDLEIRLGIKLFERTTRGAEVTENGRVFIEQARRIVTDVENLQTTARNVSYGLRGRIAVGYCSSLMSGNLKLIFSEYLGKFPEVQFDGIEGSPEKIIHGLQSQTMDVGVAPIGLSEEGLHSRPLWSERLFAALLGDSDLLSRDRIYWQDLRREVFVVSNNGIGPILGNLISARLTEQGFRPAVIYQDTSQESVLSMIAAKRFISVAAEASQGVPWQDLHFREIYDANGPARLEYALYWRADNENPALKRFFKLIEERYPG